MPTFTYTTDVSPEVEGEVLAAFERIRDRFKKEHPTARITKASYSRGPACNPLAGYGFVKKPGLVELTVTIQWEPVNYFPILGSKT